MTPFMQVPRPSPPRQSPLCSSLLGEYCILNRSIQRNHFRSSKYQNKPLELTMSSSDTSPAPPSPSESNIFNSNIFTTALDFTSNAPANLPSPPFIRVEGVPNFRELGGYACSSPGTSLRRNYLFRCATLDRITSTGATTLTQHFNIHNLYDLRSQPEIDSVLKTAGPNVLDVPGITRHSVPVYKDEDYSPIALAKKYAMYTAPDEDAGHGYSPGFVRAYTDIAQHGGPAYRKILEHVRDRPEEPLIFHCTAGKDRTGVLAALIMRLCGVDDEVIAWEYGITKQGLGDTRRVIVERLMAGDEHQKKPGMSREQAERIVGSRATNMAIFLREVLDKEFRGVRKYLEDYCGFTDEDVDKIRKNLVVEGEAVVSPQEGWKTGG